MAIYHFHASKGRKGVQSKTGKGKLNLPTHSAVASLDYINREKQYEKDAAELLHKESGNMPEWAEDDPREFWKNADKYERANGRLFRAYEVSLPNELKLDDQIELAQEMAKEITNSEDGILPYSLAIHEQGSGKNRNIHFHLVLSERVNDGFNRTPETWFKRADKKNPENGGAWKTESLEKKTWLLKARETWAIKANIALERAGFDERIDHRSLVDQEIDRIPVHIPRSALALEEKNIRTEKGEKALKAILENERRREIKRSKILTGHGREDRATSPEHGKSSGRFKDDNRANQLRVQGSSKEVGDSRFEPRGDEQTSFAALNRNSTENRATTYGDEQKFKEAESKSILSGVNNFFNGVDNSTDRILFLAEPLFKRGGATESKGGQLGLLSGINEERTNIDPEHNKKNGGLGVNTRADRTTEAVQNQIRAMGCERFEIGIREAETGKMMNRKFSSEEVVKNIPWLKRMNALGNDIFIRPEMEKRGLILVDDIDAITLEDMKANGFEPACVVETSHKNMQAWVDIGADTTPELKTIMAKSLASHFKADMASAESKHYGRLAGFTNRKPEYLSQNGYPYCLCRESTGFTAVKGEALRSMASETLKERKLENESFNKLKNIKSQNTIGNRETDPDRAYRYYFKEWIDQQPKFSVSPMDFSKGDYAVACRMLVEGGINEKNIRKVINSMEDNSPNLKERKQSNMKSYAIRTVLKASQDPRTLKLFQDRAKERSMGMGR